MTAIEHKEIKGITLGLIAVVITSTITITASVAWAYAGLKKDNEITDIRLKQVESNQTLQQAEINEIREQLSIKKP